MAAHNFCFLQECLDDETLSYMKLGLMLELGANKNFTQEEMINQICQILGIQSIGDAPYELTILEAVSPFMKVISTDMQKDNKLFESRIIRILRSCTDKLNSWQNKYTTTNNEETHRTDRASCDGIESIDLIFKLLYEWLIQTIFLPPNWSKDTIATEWYPYFFLSLMHPDYPQWMLVKDFPIELYGLTPEAKAKFIAEFPNKWENKLKNAFVDDDTRKKFKRLIFLVSFLEVLRREYALLEERYLISFPIQLPDNISSKFLRIKFDSLPIGSIYSHTAAVIMGVYAKLPSASERINNLMNQQKNGDGLLDMVQPIPFAQWQARKIVEHNSLNPFFAFISSLKYSEPSFWAQKYFDFKEYVNEEVTQLKEHYSGTLYLNHFFPYHSLKNCDIIKPEGLLTPELASDGLLTTNLTYQPLIKEGICIDLIDRIYLSLSGFNDSMLRNIDNSDIEKFSFVQTEEINTSVSKNYYRYLSNIGAWRVVKDKFEAELDKRVKAAVADIRHNIKHYLDPLPFQMEIMEEFLTTPNPNLIKIKEFAHDTYKSVKIALRELNYSLSGLETSTPEPLKWNETILRLLDEMPNLSKSISIEYNKGNVSDEFVFHFRNTATYFAQMMQNIIKNADIHGFKGANIPNPKILIESVIDNETLTLSFMNNGAPLSDGMTLAKYRTRGISKKVGNTGLGGAQIDRIVRAHGGQIFEISSNNEWNFILKIRFNLK